MPEFVTAKYYGEVRLHGPHDCTNGHRCKGIPLASGVAHSI